MTVNERPSHPMTRILAVGFAGGEFLPDQTRAHVFPETLQREDLEGLVKLIHSETGEGHAVIAVYPSWWSEPALRRLQTVRAATDTNRVLLYASPLPPLAGSVLCTLAAAVAPHITAPGLLHAGLPLLERQILPVARLRKLGGLRQPAPSVWQHLLSWWPTTSFGVSWWPRPTIRRLQKSDSAVPLPPRAAWSGVALDRVAFAADDRARTEWVAEAVGRPLDVDDVVRVPHGPLVTRFWGTGAVLEAVAYPSDAPLLASLLAEGHLALPCPWCGERVVTSECPFCRTDRAAAIAATRPFDLSVEVSS